MTEKQKDLIEQSFQAKMKNGSKIIKVTKTCYYEVQKGYYSGEMKELITEWFETYPPFSFHAFRDGSVIMEHFNEDATILEPQGEINVLDI